MQFPLLANLAPNGDDAPASGGAAGTGVPEHALPFQSVFSRNVPGPRGGDWGKSGPPDAPHLLATTSSTLEKWPSAQARAPILAEADGAVIEVAGVMTVPGVFTASPPPGVSGVGLADEAGVASEAPVAECGLPDGPYAASAVDTQRLAQLDGRLSGPGLPVAIGGARGVPVPIGAVVPEQPPVVVPPQSPEGSGRVLPVDADSSEIAAPSGRPVAEMLSPPPMRSEQHVRMVERGHSQMTAQGVLPASEAGLIAPTASVCADIPDMQGQVTNRRAPLEALPRAETPPAQRDAAPGAAPPSGNPANMHGEPAWRDPSRRAKPGSAAPRAGADGVAQTVSAPVSSGMVHPTGEFPRHNGLGPGAERRSEIGPPILGETGARAERPAAHQLVEPGVPVFGGIAEMAGAGTDVAQRAAFSGGVLSDAISDRFALDMTMTESRGAAPHTTATVTDLPGTARGVAVQMAEIISTARERSIELKLHPEELGRVSITLSHDSGVLTVAFAAERGETLDLMRRHIDLLGEELRRLGYGSVDFTFGGGNAGDHRPQGAADARDAATNAGGPATASDAANALSATPTRAHSASAAGGMDIRL